MNSRVETAVPAALNFCQRLIERGERGVHLRPAQLEARRNACRGGSRRAKPCCRRLSRPSQPSARRPFAITEPCVHPTTLDGAVSNVKAQVVRLYNSRVSVAKRLGLWCVGPHYLEDCSIGDGVGHRVKVTRLPRTRYRGNLQLLERARSRRAATEQTPDSSSPRRQGPDRSGTRDRVPFGVKQSEGLLQMSPRTHEIALEPAARPCMRCAMAASPP